MELRYGEIDENVKKRSVQDVILHQRQRIPVRENRQPSGVTSVPVMYGEKTAGMLAVTAAVNDLAAQGIQAADVFPVILFPPGTQEESLRTLMKQICRTAFPLGINVREGRQEVTDLVRRPVVIGTASGNPFFKQDQDKDRKTRNYADMDIVMAGLAGLEGTYILAAEHEKELMERFSGSLLYRIQKAGPELCIAGAAEKAFYAGAGPMVSLAGGGILAGLWELCKKTGCGMEADLPLIPLPQETIEITEYFGIDPYTIRSGGGLLIAAADGEKMIRTLSESGIFSVRIGRLTGTKDKILRNGEEIRHLDRPRADSLSLLSQALTHDFLHAQNGKKS